MSRWGKRLPTSNRWGCASWIDPDGFYRPIQIVLNYLCADAEARCADARYCMLEGLFESKTSYRPGPAPSHTGCFIYFFLLPGWSQVELRNLDLPVQSGEQHYS